MEQKPKNLNKLNNFAKFSFLGFEMAATILIFVLLGKYLDGYFNTKKPVLLAILSVLGVLFSLFRLFKNVKKALKDESSQ